ncbi:hypothetical protein ACHAW6_000954 [Cyclotella cf. meneghiniana]
MMHSLLCQSNTMPTISAYAHLSGSCGMQVQVHEKTDKPGTWAFHCVDSWYLNTFPEHYRSVTLFASNTKTSLILPSPLQTN